MAKQVVFIGSNKAVIGTIAKMAELKGFEPRVFTTPQDFLAAASNRGLFPDGPGGVSGIVISGLGIKSNGLESGLSRLGRWGKVPVLACVTTDHTFDPAARDSQRLRRVFQLPEKVDELFSALEAPQPDSELRHSRIRQ